MRVLISLALYGFLLDAVVSVLALWLPLTFLQGLAAALAYLLALVLFAVATFSTRIPKRFALPPIAFLTWANVAGGFPLAFVLPGLVHPVLAGVQLALALVLLGVHRRWASEPPPLDAPGFSWRRMLLCSCLTFVALPVFLTTGVLNSAGVYLEERSGGYFKLRPSGLLLEEREFTRDGKQVRLVSMMHIGEKKFYERVHSSLPADSSAVVLLEGITDEYGLLRSRFSYARLATMLGLESQESSTLQNAAPRPSTPTVAAPTTRKGIRYLHADADVSTFDPVTIQFINSLGVVLGSETLEDAINALREMSRQFAAPGSEQIVLDDILAKRNEHLLAEIDRNLKNAQIVIVPWGAMHLPYVEEQLRKRGFTESGRSSRAAVHFLGNP